MNGLWPNFTLWNQFHCIWCLSMQGNNSHWGNSGQLQQEKNRSAFSSGSYHCYLAEKQEDIEEKEENERNKQVTPDCGIQRATMQQRRAEENWMSCRTNALGRRADEENRPQVLPVMAKHKTEDFVYSDKGISIQQIWENSSPFSSQIYQDFTEILMLIKIILFSN